MRNGGAYCFHVLFVEIHSMQFLILLFLISLVENQSTITTATAKAFSKALVAGLDKLWKGQEDTHQLLINLIAKVNLQHNLEQDNVANLVQVKVACVYFNIMKVKQGDGNKL